MLQHCLEEAEAHSSQHDGCPMSSRPACSGHSNPEREIEMGDSKENDGDQTKGDWRELALRVQQETDPKKMIELAGQLVAKLGEKKAGKNLPPKRRTESRERPRE